MCINHILDGYSIYNIHNKYIITVLLVGVQSAAISMSVCLPAYLKNHTSKFHTMFCAYYQWPCLGPSLAIMQYVMYF